MPECTDPLIWEWQCDGCKRVYGFIMDHEGSDVQMPGTFEFARDDQESIEWFLESCIECGKESAYNAVQNSNNTV
jgi:hypothetical protein